MKLLTDKSIREISAFGTTYNKGKEMFEQNAVLYLDMKKVSDDELQVSGEVEGSTGTVYQTVANLELSQTKSLLKIKAGKCNCKAYQEYHGFCKHLVATLKEINYSVDEFEVWDLLELEEEGTVYEIIDQSVQNHMGEYAQPDVVDMLRQNGFNVSLSTGKVFMEDKPQMVTNSSQSLLDVISGVVLQERNQFCQELAGGDVNIEVTLHLNAEIEKIELRVGKNQLYVVKDMEQFVDNIRGQKFVKYGKNLEFVHTQSAFTKDALDLVSFLLDVSFEDQNYNRYYYGVSERRYLKLDERMLETLLLLFEGKSILVDSELAGNKVLTPVKREDPFLPLGILGKHAGRVAELILPEIRLLEGTKGYFIWWKNCIYICSEKFSREMKEMLKLMAVNRLRSERGNSYFYNSWKRVMPLVLCEKDYASFCATLLPVLEKYMEVKIEKIDFSKYEMEEGKVEIYLDLEQDQKVVCRANAIYGKKQHNLIQVPAVEETYRDIRTEYELRTLLEQYFPEKTADNQQYLLRNDDDRLAALVENGVNELQQLADVFVSERFKQIRIAKSAVVKTGVSVKGNLLNLTWDIEGMSQEELYEILGAYRKKRKYYRLQNGELLNLADSGISVFADMQEDLHLSKQQMKAGMAEIPLYRSLYLDALMKENADKIKASKDELFEKLIQNFDEMKIKEYAVPEEINANLRRYQLEGYQWAGSLAQMGFGGILADDMGLGKTLQMITYLSSIGEGTHLVVCPASLVYNWEAEFQKFAPSMKVCALASTAEERKVILDNWQDYDVLITSYDLLKRDIDFYKGKEFGCEIIDEAQYIKNPATQAAKAVKAIASKNRFALTGTPIENRLSELWSIFDYLMPGYLFGYKYFKETFEEKIVEKAEGEQQALERLHRMVAPFLLRRLKKEVLKDLPDKMEEVVYTKFGKKQEKLYKASEKNIVMNLKKSSGKEVQENKIQILAELTKLRQICCDPSLLYEDYKEGSAKLDTCMEVLENALEGGHRILLFSQFTTMLDILAKRLTEKNVSFFMLTGSTSKKKRRELVEQFQNGQAQVFLISLKAGGTGLNLTAADTVIHYDPWWNVAAQNQATDRTHRIGQKNDVTVIKLIAKDTIEERILKMQDMKQDLADKIISAEGVAMSALTKEDLLDLFGQGEKSV